LSRDGGGGPFFRTLKKAGVEKKKGGGFAPLHTTEGEEGELTVLFGRVWNPPKILPREEGEEGGRGNR